MAGGGRSTGTQLEPVSSSISSDCGSPAGKRPTKASRAASTAARPARRTSIRSYRGPATSGRSRCRRPGIARRSASRSGFRSPSSIFVKTARETKPTPPADGARRRPASFIRKISGTPGISHVLPKRIVGQRTSRAIRGSRPPARAPCADALRAALLVVIAQHLREHAGSSMAATPNALRDAEHGHVVVGRTDAAGREEPVVRAPRAP